MSIALGIVLAACGGASLALAMVTQRYALDPSSGGGSEHSIPLFGMAMPRNAVWVLGLLIYGAANGFYAMSLLNGPLSLLAGVFTTLLIFNMIFARLMLGEVITKAKAAGACTILIGVILTISGTPATDNDDDASGEDGLLTPSNVAALAQRPVGAAYCALLFSIVLASVLAIKWYEKEYPLLAKDSKDNATKLANPMGNPASAFASTADSSSQLESAASVSSRAERSTPVRVPAAWLDRVMAVVYPGSLGVDEGIAHLTMKASISMLDTCGSVGQCHAPTMWVFLVVWVGASVATLWWLRTVFIRYETTRALPVEYGAVNTVSAFSGLIFYREIRDMSGVQLGLTLAGAFVILCGIGISTLDPPQASSNLGQLDLDPKAGSTKQAELVVKAPRKKLDESWT